jgi:hypothetical protein
MNIDDNPQLERIEKIIEVVANAQRDMLQNLQIGLQAQIGQGENLTALAENIQRLADAQRLTDQCLKELVASTEGRFKETDERLNALIKIVDELIRRPGEPL